MPKILKAADLDLQPAFRHACDMSDSKPAKPEASQRLEIIRHSVSHVMAEAVTRLYPGTKVAIGPSIESGFYYDFQFQLGEDGKAPISSENLPAIEAEMKKIIESRWDFVRVELSREEALKRFAGETFKQELISELPPDEVISIYENRDAAGAVMWADLCRGPHVQNTREIHSGAFKLMSIAGAYWRGD